MIQGDRVLLTGATGFIAKHVLLELLRTGYRVRATVRERRRGNELTQLAAKHGLDPQAPEVFEADLQSDKGWIEAADGCRYVIHTASPFPMSQPRDKFALVAAARDGALRVVDASKRVGVECVVLTSSVAAMYYGLDQPPDYVFDEGDFSDVSSAAISPYAVSKTLAEQAGWDAIYGSSMRMVAINPALVLGPLLDQRVGTSVRLVDLLVRGRLPLLPDVTFGIVDVRDVASAHVAALQPDAAGRRFVLSSGNRTLSDMAAVVKDSLPHGMRRRTWGMPSAPVLFVSRFSSRAAMLAAELGRKKLLNTGPAQQILGIEFRSPEEAIQATVDSLLAMRKEKTQSTGAVQ